MSLPQTQQEFVMSYIANLGSPNAIKLASKDCGLTYSYCRKLLLKPAIQEQIENAKLERLQRLEMDADTVLKELIQLWQADIRDIYDDDDTIKPVNQWPEVITKMLVSYQKLPVYNEEGKQVGSHHKIRLIDRLKVLEMIGKHIKVQAFKEKHELSMSDGLAEQLMAARLKLKNTPKR